MKLITLLTARKTLPLDIAEIDIQLKYKIMKFIKSTNSDEEFYRSEIENIVSKYAQHDQDGNVKQNQNGDILIDVNMAEQFQKAIDALNNTEIDTKNFSLSMDEISQLKLNVKQMLDLDGFIE